MPALPVVEVRSLHNLPSCCLLLLHFTHHLLSTIPPHSQQPEPRALHLHEQSPDAFPRGRNGPLYDFVCEKAHPNPRFS